MLMASLEKEIAIIVSNILEIEEDVLWENRDQNLFEVLDLDSLLSLEIVASIEKKYKIEIFEEKLEAINNFDAIVQTVIELIEVKKTA
jgi:acyl carrier protein